MNNTIKAKAVINSGTISTADWTNAKNLADSIKSACASYSNNSQKGKNYQFTVALIGERKIIDGNTTDILEVKSKIKFEDGAWDNIQDLEENIRDAVKDNSSSEYEIKSYVDKKYAK